MPATRSIIWGVVGELPGFQPGVRVTPPGPAVPPMEALKIRGCALPRHAERIADGSPQEAALELIEHLNSTSLKIHLKGCYSAMEMPKAPAGAPDATGGGEGG